MYACEVGVYVLEHLGPVLHELEKLSRDFRLGFTKACPGMLEHVRIEEVEISSSVSTVLLRRHSV